jgi:spore coat protein U-like protein
VASGANTRNYTLYSDSGHHTAWDNTAGTGIVSGTNNDAITVTITY